MTEEEMRVHASTFATHPIGPGSLEGESSRIIKRAPPLV